MKLLKHYLLRLGLLTASLLILSVPLIWLQIYHPQVVYSAGNFMVEYSKLLIMLRFTLILGLYLSWPRGISRIAEKKGWSVEKKQFWVSQRLKVTI